MKPQPLPAYALFAEFGFNVFYLLYLRDGDPGILIPGGVLLLATVALTVRNALRAPRRNNPRSDTGDK